MRDLVSIDNVSGDISVILSNIECKKLWIDNQELSCDTTESLVTAMSNSVEVVGLRSGVHLDDIGALTVYHGMGRCRSVACYGETGRRYRSQLEAWAHNIGWGLSGKDSNYYIISYRQENDFPNLSH